MKAINFFTDNITLIPHSTSTELAHLIGKPVTLAQLQVEVGAQAISLYELASGDLYAAVRPAKTKGYQPFFIEGPESAALQVA